MGFFSKIMGGTVSRKNKQRSEDETSINSGVEHAPPEGEPGADVADPADRSGEDETSINSGVAHAPAEEEAKVASPNPDEPTTGDLPGEPVRAAHDGNTQASAYSPEGEQLEARPLATTPSQPDQPLSDEQVVAALTASMVGTGPAPEPPPKNEGETDQEYSSRLEGIYARAVEQRAAAAVDTTGSLPGQPAQGAHDGNTNASKLTIEQGAGTPPIANISQQNEFAEERRQAQLRQYVIEQGLAPIGAVENMDDRELAEIYEKSLALKGTTSTPSLDISPAQHAQAVLMSSSKEDKRALVTEKSNLSAEHVVLLSDEDLDNQVRNVVIGELQLEAQKRAEDEAKLKPIAEQPYGGDAPRFYAVQKGASFAAEGQVVTVRDGQVVNDRSHNIAELRSRGIQLIECVAPAAPGAL